MTARYWKVTDAKGRSCHGGQWQWSLPTWDGVEWTPGEWTPRIDDATACKRGWHCCTDAHLVQWVHERIWQVEIHPDAVTTVLDDKVVTTGPVRLVAGTPWDATTARLFAVQCAARVLHLTDDPRVADALVVAFRHAVDDATDVELAAAGAAASAAAWDAAWTATRAAAWDAARYAAAWAAAGAAAGVAQTADLLVWLEVAA